MPLVHGLKTLLESNDNTTKQVPVPEPQKELHEPEAQADQGSILSPQQVALNGLRPSCPPEHGHVRKISVLHEEGAPMPRVALVQQLAGIDWDEDVAELLVKVKTLREHYFLGLEA